MASSASSVLVLVLLAVLALAYLPSPCVAQSSLTNQAVGSVPLTVTATSGTTVDIFRIYDDDTLSFYVDQYGNTYVTGSLGTASDRRLKHNFTGIDGALAKVLRMRGVEYNYNATLLPHTEGKRDMGFIAQEVKEVEPLLVKRPSSGDHKQYYHVEYAKVSPLLVEAVKEMHGLFEDESAALEDHIGSLRASKGVESARQGTAVTELNALLQSVAAFAT